MLARALLLLLAPHCAWAGGSVSINIKDLGAIEGVQSLDIRGGKKLFVLRSSAEVVYKL